MEIGSGCPTILARMLLNASVSTVTLRSTFLECFLLGACNFLTAFPRGIYVVCCLFQSVINGGTRLGSVENSCILGQSGCGVQCV